MAGARARFQDDLLELHEVAASMWCFWRATRGRAATPYLPGSRCGARVAWLRTATTHTLPERALPHRVDPARRERGVRRGSALVVTPRIPWPRDDGGKIVLWQSVWSVAQDYDTTLVTLTLPGEEVVPPPPEFRTLGVDVVRVPHRPPPLPIALIRGTMGRWPYTLTRHHSRTLEDILRRIVARRKPSFVLLNNLSLATHLDSVPGQTVVLRQQNAEHLLLGRYADGLANPVARAFARAQASRLLRTEADLCARCDLVLAIQEIEADTFRRIAPTARVEVVPIGIDMGRYLPRAPEVPPIGLIVGSFNWPPNAEGARRFLERGWPRVKARVPGARLRLAGKNLSSELARESRSVGADAVGYVDDMAVEFARAAALVVPLWVGAGARVKIVESLAARLPVVTTSLGAEGLGLEPGTHAVFAETPEALGDALADLLAKPDRGLALADAGCRFVRAHFSLDAVTRHTIELCASAVARRERGS
jgi:glycosyltransferase involved in cell wall biosynthesis